MAATREVTRNLIDWRNGNEAAIEKILPVVYDELKRSARRSLRRESSDISIQTTEFINEAYFNSLTNERPIGKTAHIFLPLPRE